MQNNGMSIKKATLINSAAKYYSIICSFIVNMILSRLLTPNDYGVVAVVTVFTTFFTMFSDLGFGTAYIQNKTLDDNDRNNLFTFLVYVGVILFAVFYVFAWFIAWFYGDDVYIGIAHLLGINLFVTAVDVIPSSDMLKRQKFGTAAFVQAFSTTVAAVSAVFFAYHGFAYYAIVFQSLISTGVMTVIYLVMVRPKFVFKIHMESVRKVAGFSVGQFGFSFINYFSRNIDNLLLGKLFGDEQLGYYDKAYKTSTYVVSNFASIIGSSIQPVLARYQDDREYVYAKFKRSFLFLLTIGTFFSVFLNQAARETILILYGDQWEPSVPAFAFLALSLFAQLSLNITGAFYQVLNNTKLMALNGLLSAFLLVGGILIGIFEGSITTVAKWYFIAQIFNFVLILFIMHRFLFRRPAVALIKEIARTLISGGILYVLLKLLYRFVPGGLIVRFIIKFVIAAALYYALMVLFNSDESVMTVIFPRYRNPIRRRRKGKQV